MENNQENTAQVPLKTKVNTFANRAAIAVTPIAFAVAAHAEDATVDIGTLAITGLAVSAASVFAVKASPSLMMWGYRKLLGFIGR